MRETRAENIDNSPCVVSRRSSPRTSSRRAGRSGFTLVEFLVALGLVGLMAGYGLAVLAYGTRLRVIEHRLERDAEVAAVADHLRQAIGAARLLSMEARGGSGETRLAFVGEAGRVTVATPGDRRLEVGGLYLAQYRFAPDATGERLVTTRHLFRPLAERVTVADTEIHLLRGIEHGSLRYFGAHADGEAARWSDRWDRNDRLPMLVEISVDFLPASGLAPMLLRIPIEASF